MTEKSIENGAAHHDVATNNPQTLGTQNLSQTDQIPPPENEHVNEIEILPEKEPEKQNEEQASDNENETEANEADDQNDVTQQKVPQAIYKRFYRVFSFLLALGK